MALAKAKCTNCGEIIEVEETKDADICPYCKNAYIVEKAINNYNMTCNTGSIESTESSKFVPKVTIDHEDTSGFEIQAGILKKYTGAPRDIVIPSNVITIGALAFNDCRGLRSVVIPGTVKTIEASAFSGCVDLESIIISDGVKKIGGNAFKGCKSLIDIVIPDSVEEMAAWIFNECTNLVSIILPKGLKEIATGLFAYCENLKEIDIPSNLEIIGASAFAHCKSLSTILLPDSIKTIDYGAFEECTSLETINISCNIEVISKSVFKRCTNLKIINMPKGIVMINEGAFAYCSSLENINIPDGVEIIGEWAFAACKNLKELHIPKDVRFIGEGAFCDCNNLSVKLPRGLDIKENTFTGCQHVILETSQGDVKATIDKKGRIKEETKACYIATCVYGSYNCPPVWTLRRYRDTVLSNTYFGRIFIHIYYAISPTLVRWFGDKQWFKKFWKKHLDRLVNRLETSGIENTEYKDFYLN